MLLLQHPREQWTAIGTARMAHLALTGSTLRIGIDFSNDAVVRHATRQNAYVLFPGEGAIAPADLPPGPPITLVVVDGTWTQAQKLLRMNPAIASLPRIGLSPARPSEYQIRKQPAEFCVSTIEALAELLPVLEQDDRFDALRGPFRAMVATQQRYVSEVGARRHARTKTVRPTRVQRLAAKLRDVADRIVCVQGDANGWARNDPRHQPAESVAWTARRQNDGADFRHFIAPLKVLAPATVDHVGRSEDELRAGSTALEWQQRWNEFVRPDDVLVHWGRFYVDLAEQEGLWLPATRFDLRVELTQALGERVATVENGAQRLGGRSDLAYIEPLRAARRLDALCRVVTGLLATTLFAPQEPLP